MNGGGGLMKKFLPFLGFIIGAVYAWSTAVYVNIIVREVNFGISFISKNADFSVFTTKTYFEVYYPYVLYLFCCLPLVLFLLFYFFCVVRSKLTSVRHCIIALVWCLSGVIMLSIPQRLTINIFSRTPAFPSSGGYVITNFDRILPSLTHFLYATMLMLFFLIFLNIKHAFEQYQKRQGATTTSPNCTSAFPTQSVDNLPTSPG